MKKIEAVIFDIDGTLTDSMGVWEDADRIFLERRGKVWTRDVSLAMKPMHFMSASRYLKERFGFADSPESIAAEITDIVRDKYFREIALMPYVGEFMEYCRGRGVHMCAATSNSRELAEGVLENNGILDMLDFIITSDEAGSGKDDPRIFFMCAERMGTLPENTAVAEDSPHAAAAAFNNGFYTIGADSGYFGDFERLKDCTHIRVSSFKELIGKFG
ncbi:MAG: HAD family phosphatase [Ruminococcus sp.]|nr:HAD family phosphatase [Ruminococcus sp.]